MDGLSATENSKFFEQCLPNLFDMIIECNARICARGMDTNAAEREYSSTKTRADYAETKTNEERAWVALCQVYGSITPKTDSPEKPAQRSATRGGGGWSAKMGQELDTKLGPRW